MRKFYEVKKDFKKVDLETKLPEKSTKTSAGYDFFSKIAVSVAPNQIVKIWTDVKVQMEDDEVLLLFPRSSMGGKFMLANTVGVIDSDYFSNSDNDGNIGLFLKNISDKPQTIHIGDKVAQGVFVKFLSAENGNSEVERIGGFGSTGK